MEMNSKRLELTSRILYFSIAIILCSFLILLSNNIINDLDRTITEPKNELYFDNKKLKDLRYSLENIQIQNEQILSQVEVIDKTLQVKESTYKNEKISFDNWIEARKTLGASENNIEITSRAQKLDQYFKIAEEWKLKKLELQKKLDENDIKIKKTNEQIDKETNTANKIYEKDYSKYELKVFLIRLLFVSPILIIGIFLFIRYRNNKYWPLFYGFILFSLYVFFFGLLPYLPSYGGYVRNTVGILLSIGLGYYAIKHLRNYIELKKAEMLTSTSIRANKIKLDTAEKAFNNHYCPSCGKDFILKKWENIINKKPESDFFGKISSFCKHCGLELFNKCQKCDNINFSHLPFCSNCGHKASDTKNI